jgi:HK97 family phage major capsid protein
MQMSEQEREKYALQVGGTGAYLVGQYHDAASFIDLLYAESMAPRLGVTMLPGLTGDVDIPRLTTGHTGYWVGESTAPTASTTVLGRLLLQPKTVAGRSEVSRKLIKQATPAVENILMQDLSRAIADAVDVAITQGSGSSNQPAGLAKALTDASISANSCTSVDYSKILAFITGLQTAKAYRPGVKWLTTPTVAAVLNNKQKVSTVWSPIYDMDTKSMIGSPVEVTPNCKASHLFFGLFSDIIMADWGMVELEMVNSTATPDNGDKTLRAFFDVDFGVRRPASFQWSSVVSA